MRALFLSLVTASIFISVNAVHLVKRSNPAVVGLEIEREHIPNPVQHDKIRQKRQESDNKTVNATLENEKTLYFCNITLGTPQQKLRMHIDSGSSDLWVNTPSSRLCRSRRRCAQSGTYNPSKSSTYKYVSNDFNITYADGSGAVGDYVTDTIGVAGVTLKNFQFAVGNRSTSQQGVLGVGYTSNEVQVTKNNKKAYPNLPKALVQKGFINSNAYSLWLNDLDASKGEILFGGVNLAKFEGDLQTIPVLKRSNGKYNDLAVALTGLSISAPSGSSSFPKEVFPLAAVLDTGSSLSYLPSQMVAEIFRSVDAVFDTDLGAAYVPCDLNKSTAKFEFEFSKPKISVGMDELVIDPGPTSDGRPLTFTDGTPACIFGITTAQNNINILGDTLLRSAYVVYDLDNNEISLAQTRFNTTKNDVVEIGKGSDAVPNATVVSKAVTSAPSTITATATLKGAIGFPIRAASSSSTAAAAPTMHPGLPAGMLAGLAGAGAIFAAM